jgi:Holliday junction resolvase RusA-like endonuclease
VDGSGKVHFYTKDELREIEDMIRAQMAPFVTAAPLDGPLALLMEWYFPWRKTEPAKNRVKGRKWHTSKPDCSNIIKAPEDQLTRLRFWNDDGQIADLHVRKFWADTPGIRVVITQLSEE